MPFSMVSTVATASTPPAPPSRWPVMLLVLTTAMSLAWSPKTAWMAAVSQLSFMWVPVPWALMWSICSGAMPPSLRVSFMQPNGTCAAGCGSREVVGVAVGAVAHDFGIDVCAAGLGVLQLFQHQHTAALTHHKAAAPCVEGQAGRIRVRSSGEGLHAGKAADAQRADAALGTAADHDRLIAVADAVERIAHSVGAACTGRHRAGTHPLRGRSGWRSVLPPCWRSPSG